MNRILKFTGIIVWVIGILSLVVYLRENYQVFNEFLRFVGLLFIVVIISYTIFRTIWGNKWIIKGGQSFFIGSNLIKSLKQFLDEQPNPSNQTTSNLAGHLVYRITRIGAFGFLIGFLPAILLWQQNRLFDYQNSRIDEQTNLFRSQDSLIRIQTSLLKSQDTLTRQTNAIATAQTELVNLQTERLGSQNNLISVQNDLTLQEFELMEAGRRSSLIFLMSNVMDKLHEEVEDQRKNPIAIEPSEQPFNEYKLSPSLMGRIIGLSRSLKPYYVLENRGLSKNKISPERGQILITLLNSQISDESLDYIFSRSDFSFADLDFSNSQTNKFTVEAQALNLGMLQYSVLKNVRILYTDGRELQLNKAILNGVSFFDCDLSKANFSNALVGVEFSHCNLTHANFANSDLLNAKFDKSCLSYANFENAKNLNFEQFKNVKSLYGAKHLPQRIIDKLDKYLFDEQSSCFIPKH